MATTGFILGSSNNNDNGVYSDWTNPGNFNVDDANAAASAGSSGALSVWFLSGYDFATAGLSSGDTINDVEFRVRLYDAFGDTGTAINLWWDDTTSDVFDTVITGKTATRFPASGSTSGTSGSPQTVTLSCLDTLPTADELLDANFQIAVQNIAVDSFTNDARAELVAVNVDYTAAGGGSIIPQIMHHRKMLGIG